MADILNDPLWINEDGTATEHFKEQVIEVLRADETVNLEDELKIIEGWGPTGAPTAEPQAYYEAWTYGLKFLIAERKGVSK